MAHFKQIRLVSRSIQDVSGLAHYRRRISNLKYFLAGRLSQGQANQSPVNEFKIIQFVGLVELTSLRNSCKRRHRGMGQLLLFFSFLCRHYLVDSLSLANYYSLHYVKFRETFAHFRQHSTSFFLTMRATSLLASFLRRNFGTRFLNRENNWDCGNSIFPENSLSIAFNSRCQRTGPLSQKDS